MTRSLADEISDLPTPEDTQVAGSDSVLSITPDLTNSDTTNIPPHILSRIAVENISAEPVMTAAVEEISEPVVTESDLLDELKRQLIDKGANPEVVAKMTLVDFEIIGKTRKNKMVTTWAHKRKANAIIKQQATVSPIEQPKTSKVKTTMSKYDNQIEQNAKDIADLKKGMAQMISLAKSGAFANQTAVIPATPMTTNSGIPKVAPAAVNESIVIPKIVSTPVVIPKVFVPTTATGEKLAPADFYRFLITEKKKHNTPYTKGKKTYPASKGVHAVISGFNQDVKDYYGQDTDVVKLTNMLVQQGVIVMQMARKGPMFFLPEDFRVSENSY